MPTLTSNGDYAKFELNAPIPYVTAISGFQDDLSGNPTAIVKKEFRYSFNDKVKSVWVEMTPENFSNAVLNPNEELFVDFRYTLIANGPVTVNWVKLLYTQDPIAKDKFVGFQPACICCETGNISSIMKCENFTFEPYKVNAAISLYKDLSYTINKLFGHDVQYARATPLGIGKDVTLKEWTLYDVNEPECFKILVPNNEFPDNKINFGQYGLDFEMPFEVHIVKQYFEDVFGVGHGPQKRDIIYFPLANRIYEVGSSYLFRDFMHKDSYWKVSLVKYAPRSNRYEPTDLREGLDEISWDHEERFGEEVRSDELKKTKPQQYNPKLGSNSVDPVRVFLNEDLNIVESRVVNYHTVLSDSQYDLRSIYDPNDSSVLAVRYANHATVGADENRSFTAWFKDLPPKTRVPRDLIFNIVQLTPTPQYDATLQTLVYLFSITLNVQRQFSVNDIIKITRFNGFSIFGYWDSSSGSNHVIKIPKDIVDAIQPMYPNWITQSSNYAELAQDKIMFSGFNTNNNTGWEFSIIAKRFFLFKSNDERYYFTMREDISETEWYGLWLNISNTYGQLTVDLWKRRWDENSLTPDQTTDLEKIYTQTINTLTSEDRSYEPYSMNFIANFDLGDDALSVLSTAGLYLGMIVTGPGISIPQKSVITYINDDDLVVKISKPPVITLDNITLTATDPEDRYYLKPSELLLTNIRLFKETEPEDKKQMFLLNQNIVQDSDLAIVIDNALPRLKLPFIAQTK
jgi:hypothetical protein